MKKIEKKLALRKETLLNLQLVTGGTTVATTAGTTSLIMTLPREKSGEQV
jgi:hypothetical protein